MKKHIGLVVVLAVGAVIGSLLTVYLVQDMLRTEAAAEDVRKATKLCNSWANRLAVIKPNGEFKREYEGELPEQDVWGSPLSVEYFKVQRNSMTSMGIDHLKVISLGPDRKQYTDDDIVAERTSRFGPGALIGE